MDVNPAALFGGGAQDADEPAPGTMRLRAQTAVARRSRTMFFKIFGAGSTMVALMIWTIFPIYWGALWKTPRRRLDGWVVDFDGGMVGERVVQALTAETTPGAVAWAARPASDFPGGVEELGEQVKDHRVWTAIAISPDTTSALLAALRTPDASYNGSEALIAFSVEARNENAYRGLIRPTIDAVLTRAARQIAHATAEFATAQADTVDAAALLATAPQTLYAPVGHTLRNLIPFDQPVATAATFVGMLYSLLMGLFVTIIAFMAREITGLNRRLGVRSLIQLRLACCLVAYLVLALFYSLMNLAFALDFSREFGRGGFFVFWMLTYLGMLAMCLAMEAMITLTGPPGMPFFVLLWIITNLSVTIFPIELLPRVFRYGYAFPFYNLALGMRTVIFGTKNELGRVVGVLLGWIGLSCITMSLLQWLRHPARAAAREARKGAASPALTDTLEAEETKA